jgi:hypothetical protein
MSMQCPICHQKTVWKNNRWRPFCSERCQLLDLGAWVTERYRIASDPGADERDPEEST